MTTFLHLGCSLTKLDNTNHQKPEKIRKSKQFPFRKWPGEVSTTKTDWAINFVTRCPRSWHQNLDAVIRSSTKHFAELDRLISPITRKHIPIVWFFLLTFGDAATSVKDARALWMCPMKEHFKIMLKQKNNNNLHLITAKEHVLSLKVRRAERQSKKLNYNGVVSKHRRRKSQCRNMSTQHRQKQTPPSITIFAQVDTQTPKDIQSYTSIPHMAAGPTKTSFHHIYVRQA